MYRLPIPAREINKIDKIAFNRYSYSVNKTFNRPIIVSSKYSGFYACRWNDMTILDLFIKKFKPFVKFKTACPEEEMRSSVPRNPIRLVKNGIKIRLMKAVICRDVTTKSTCQI